MAGRYSTISPQRILLGSREFNFLWATRLEGVYVRARGGFCARNGILGRSRT